MGCFWGAERKFWELGDGIYATAVGYAGGPTPNPTYEEVCSGRTGHNEVVFVVYDPKKNLLREAPERPSGRTTTRPRACARATTRAPSTAPASTRRRRRRRRPPKRSKAVFGKALQAKRFGDITTEILDAPPFYFAEDYHQQYLAKNPMGYCGLGGTGVSCPIGTGVGAAAN